MSVRSRFTLLTIATAFAAHATPPTWATTKPPLCTGGRFAIAGSPLLGPGGEVVVLENGALSIGSLCPPRHATLARRKKGTAVSVVFRGCSGVSGRVRLTALIGNNCSTVTGNLKAGGTTVPFSAATSECGDAIVDTGGGEDCDGSATGCFVGEACNAACRCAQTSSKKSGPIAVTDDGKTVIAANIDTGTVSFFAVDDDGTLAKLTEVRTGDEPRSVATLSNKPWVYVANTVSGTVSVLDVGDFTTIATVRVGTEPWAVVASPNGSRVYVANANDNAVQVIDTDTNDIIATVPVGRSPRALA